MRQYFIAIVLVLSTLVSPLTIAAVSDSQPQNSVVFNEIFMGSTSSASEEFIEITNVSDEQVDLSGWSVQYFSSTATDLTKPFRTFSLTGIIEPHSYFLLSSKDYLVDRSNLQYSATLSQTAGTLRLLNTNGQQDLISWGNTVIVGIQPLPAIAAGSSWARDLNPEGLPIISGNMSTDFVSTDRITPSALNDIVVEQPAVQPDTSVETPDTAVTEEQPQENVENVPEAIVTPPRIEITELLPNPASPATDDNDEFVELLNLQDQEVNLTGLTLITGIKDSYKFKLDNIKLAAGERLSLYSRDTNLVLSNTAGRAKVVTADGWVIDETAPYESAKEGQSWSVINGQWQWTLQATPSLENVLKVPEEKVTAAKASTASAKKTSTKKTTASTSKTKTAAASKTKSSDKDLAASPVKTSTETTEKVAGLNPLVLAGLAVMVVVYGVYEYRNDLANRLYQFRRYRASRHAAG